MIYDLDFRAQGGAGARVEAVQGLLQGGDQVRHYNAFDSNNWISCPVYIKGSYQGA